MNYRLVPEDIPNEGTLFVDHSLKNRSGHLSHALTEYKKGCVFALWSNCSGKRNRWAPGHNGFGWLEYATSEDMGDTWSEPKVLSYSWDSFLNEPFTVSCEKAVSPWENRIVLLCIRNENPNGWEPYLEPVVLISDDAGESWSEPKQLCPFKGRVYDAMMIDGDIYVLMLANDDFATSKPEHRYQIYVSRDGGESFQLLSELPGEYLHHAYGSMERLPDGRLICYTYNEQDEFNLDCWISRDMGLTWPERLKSFCKRRIRNPQVARVKGGYILHGRSGCVDASLPMQFVLYTSTDGIHWDDGTVLCDKHGNAAYYSNNLVMTRDDGTQRVLIQASVSYDKGKVNINHWIMEFE
ncbi:MAG: exo-alpha-sialidase [Clostridia bacterium]|nr:exo-alpha-sialidase [Clostridia bacterium]